MVHEVSEVLMAEFGTTLVNGHQLNSIDVVAAVHRLRAERADPTAEEAVVAASVEPTYAPGA